MHALGPDWMDPQYLLDTYGTAFFWISLVIVFIECGLFFPILPGDSLLFAIGIFIAGGELDIPLARGDPRAVRRGLRSATSSATRSAARSGRRCATTTGGSSARSTSTRPTTSSRSTAPRPWSSAASCRSCAPTSPLVAGIGRMDRRHFFTWSAVGAALWVTSITLAGYFLGGVPIIRDHLEAAILLIVVPLGAADALRVPQAPPRGEGHRRRHGRDRRPDAVEDVRDGSA